MRNIIKIKVKIVHIDHPQENNINTELEWESVDYKKQIKIY